MRVVLVGAGGVGGAMTLLAEHRCDVLVNATDPRFVMPLFTAALAEWSMAGYGAQTVVWQTAVNPVVALEPMAAGTWTGAGVLGPEDVDALPSLDLLGEHGAPGGTVEVGSPPPHR